MLCIQTEASHSLGHGHVMRCISLAEKAMEQGVTPFFLCRDDYTANFVKSRGFSVSRSISDRFDAKWIIRDFRDGSVKDEVIAEVGCGVAVLLLDEAGDARKFSTIVSDCMMVAEREKKYSHNSNTQYLYGLKYAPLNSCYNEPKHGICFSEKSEYPILISLGVGESAQYLTLQVIRSLNVLGFSGSAIVVIDSMGSAEEEIKGIVSRWSNSRLVKNISDMKYSLDHCSLVVTKLGMMMLEAFSRGRGCITIEPTNAHVLLHEQLAKMHNLWPAIAFNGVNEVNFTDVAETIMRIYDDKQWLTFASIQGRNLVDGAGSKRLIKHLINDN